MLLFLDTEFTGLTQDTSLISIGIVSEATGRTFYGEFCDYDRSKVDKWITQHVIANLLHIEEMLPFKRSNAHTLRCAGSTTHILTCLMEYISGEYAAVGKKLVVVSDCYAYDWVLFNQLFYGVLNIPKELYYIPIDISTIFHVKGIDPDINREEYVGADNLPKHIATKHNALWDAYVIQCCYNRLMGDT